MTSGLKTPSSYYIELITTFAPRPITNETELIQAKIGLILSWIRETLHKMIETI